MSERQKLNMLDLSDPEFYEREEEALDMLPRNQSGLKELIEYIEMCDSHAAYKKLQEDFRNFISKELYEQYVERACRAFDKELVQEWIS